MLDHSRSVAASSKLSAGVPLFVPVSATQVHFSDDRFAARSSVVADFLRSLALKGQFTIGSIRREQWKHLACFFQSRPDDPAPPVKPTAYIVEEMADPAMFLHGKDPLDSPTMNPDAMRRSHLEHCTYCAPGPDIRPDCYFHRMWLCVANGWIPPADWSSIRPCRFRGADTNYPAFNTFIDSNTVEFNKMTAAKMAVPVGDSPVFGPIIPMGCVLKSSDVHRARALTGVSIVCQQTLAAANAILEKKRLPKIKTRITMDATASGFNRIAYSPSFRYLSLYLPLSFIKRDSYLGKGDLSRFFWSFDYAAEMYGWFVVMFLSVLYYLRNVFFGMTSAPFYTSAYGAEMVRVLVSRGVVAFTLLDDWLTIGDTREHASQKLMTIKTLATDWGFGWNQDKEEIGQRIVFLGLLIDTCTMTIRFEKSSAAAFILQLQSYLLILEAGQSIADSTVHHVAGKLNWFSEVVQSGRLRIRSWWRLLHYGSALSSAGLETLFDDTHWWIVLLTTWANDESSSLDYDILSASELIDTPGRLHIGQSDSSGLDGFGYFHGDLHSVDSHAHWVSVRWPYGYLPESSLTGELNPLLHFLERTPITSCVLVWVMDSAAAVFAIDRGKVSTQRDFELLSKAYALADVKRIQLLALWVPRELNSTADTLSHLSHLLNRSTTEGVFGTE